MSKLGDALGMSMESDEAPMSMSEGLGEEPLEAAPDAEVLAMKQFEKAATPEAKVQAMKDFLSACGLMDY